MTTATLLRPGEMLGGFRIDDVIGIGGMAIVYRAEQISLGRAVALKVLSHKLTSDTVFRERFRREGNHAATLEHPNIVPVYDSGEQDGHLYLAMRLVEGTNLAETIQTRGLTADQTIELLRPIASALDTAHAAGLIHRDVKPQNILITAQGHPYLADFGVAKGSNTDGLTATGGFVGSVNYASPEQIRGLTLTPASDVYALTAVLYQCLTGQVPYPRETDAGIMHAHLTEPPPTLPVDAGADSDFHTVLARGMAKDPGARYGHAGDLLNAAALAVGRLPSKTRTAIPAFPLSRAIATGTVEGRASDPEAARPSQADAPVQPSSETEVVARERLRELRQAGAETAADRRRPPPPEATSPPAAARRRRWPLLAVVFGALAVLAVLLLLLLASNSSRSSTGLTLRSAHLSVQVTGDWRRGGGEIGGLPLESPAFAVSRAETLAAVGTLQAPIAIAGGAPASFVSRNGRPGSSSLVRLPLGLARNYSWQRPTTGAISLYVVASSRGELVLACRTPAPTALKQLSAACGSLAEHTRVVGAHVEYPGPDPSLAAALRRTLDSRRHAARADTSTARLSSRAPALALIAKVDAAAAVALLGAKPASRYGAGISSLAAALKRESSTLRSLASAARAGSRRLYASRRARLASDAAALARATGVLRARGFSLPRVSAVSVAALPAPPPRTTHTASTSVRGTGSVTPAPSTSPTPRYVPPPTKSSPRSHGSPAPHRSAPQTIVSAPS